MSPMAWRLAESETTTKCHCCRLPPVGACTARVRHSRMISGSTGRVKSCRLRTDRVVASISSGVRLSAVIVFTSVGYDIDGSAESSPIVEPFPGVIGNIDAAMTSSLIGTIRVSVRYLGAGTKRLSPGSVMDIVALIPEVERVVDVLRGVVKRRPGRPGRVENCICDFTANMVHPQ